MQKILVVDDSPTVREVLAFVLEERGYTVSVAFDGAMGFEKALAEHFDLIITDLEMPNSSGLDLLQALRRGGIATPVILLSGIGADEIKKYLQHGFARAIDKPFRNEAVCSAVSELLGA